VFSNQGVSKMSRNKQAHLYKLQMRLIRLCNINSAQNPLKIVNRVSTAFGSRNDVIYLCVYTDL
jgi:hypothetical protein